MRDLVLVSVPAHDAAAAAAFAGLDAVLIREPLAAASVPDARVLSVMAHDAVTPARLATMPSLEAIITRSDGFDHLPLDWLRQRGIAAYHLEGYATAAVAELTVAAIIALLRRVPEAHHATAAGSWDRSALVGRTLAEARAGIVGLGRIGGRVARLLAGLGADVTGHDTDPAAGRGIARAPTLEALLDGSDILSLHVPLTPATRGLIGAAELARLPDGAVLVNTARGAVVDQHAVRAALVSGRLGGYAADVLPGEPHPPDVGSFPPERTVITPHLGAHTTATIQARYRLTARIARAVVSGRPADAAAYRL